MRSAIVFGLAIGGTTACTSDADQTDGELGHAGFSYIGEGCQVIGCPTSRAIMLGSTELISVVAKSGSVPVVTAQVSDASILSATVSGRECCTSTKDGGTCRYGDPMLECASDEVASETVSVSAIAAGTAQLQLIVADGSTFDSLELSVAAPDQLTVSCREENQPDVTSMAAGTSCMMRWNAVDGRGKQLQASTGVTVSVEPLSVAGLEPSLAAPLVAMTAGDQGSLLGTSLDAVASGTATVTATATDAPSVSGTMSITVP
ncbi:MAG TPA: hypothetical protein VMJ10_24840 [Kofleriaceae bacterium]|nr:hypothetical protein [Kofleriaceae bacterium]